MLKTFTEVHKMPRYLLIYYKIYFYMNSAKEQWGVCTALDGKKGAENSHTRFAPIHKDISTKNMHLFCITLRYCNVLIFAIFLMAAYIWHKMFFRKIFFFSTLYSIYLWTKNRFFRNFKSVLSKGEIRKNII